MEKIISFLLARLKEPSSWAGVAVFLGLFGVSDEFSNRLANDAPIIAGALTALVAVFLPSRAVKKDTPPEDPR